MRKPSPRRRFRPLSLEPFEPRRLLAFAAELVADVNATPFSPQTLPSGISDVNGIALYSAFTAAHGHELWRSDGTPSGTSLVEDILPGAGSSFARYCTNVNGTVFFTARDTSGVELWRSDGTAEGTFVVKEIRSGEESSQPLWLVNVNGTLFFTADDGVHGRELWRSDGTEAGTVLVRDIGTGSADVPPQFLTAAGNLVFFTADDSQGRLRLWRSNGTEAGTFRITQNDSPGNLTAVNDKLFFTQTTATAGEELWFTTGKTIETGLMADIRPGAASSSPRELTNVNGTLFFRADDGQHGRELWKSSGTFPGSGAMLVRDLDVGTPGYPNSFGPTYLFNGNGTLYFTNALKNRLWQSDGTEAGTVPIPGTTPAPNHSSFHIYGGFAEVGGTVYFSARGDAGVELWKTTGPAEGKVLVKDLYPGAPNPEYPYQQPFSSLPDELTNVGGKLLFRAMDANGYHLWTSDGTSGGTLLVDFVDVRTRSGDVKPILDLNGKLLLTANDGNGTAYWTSDGTAAGTQKLALPRTVNDLTNINGTLYFAGSDSPFRPNLELWKSDGTNAGTMLVVDIFPGSGYGAYGTYPNSSRPAGFTGLGNKIIFAAFQGLTNSEKGRELWLTDGTQAGTQLVRDIATDRFKSSNPSHLTRLGNAVYFTADNKSNGVELWRTDGTEDGTWLVNDIRSGAASGDPQNLVVSGGKLYFTADDGAHGRELWQSDGTTAGTVVVKDITPGGTSSNIANLTDVRGTLYFTTSPDGGDKLLWKTDGTADGTVFIANIGTAADLTNGNGTLYFVSDVGGTGAELWKSNGTAAGTVRVKDLVPGPGGSRPERLQGINGVLFLEADFPNGGRGFWLSNGTAEGTVPVLQDSAPLTGMRFLTNVSGQLFFAGTDVEHGEELWKLTTANPVVQFSGSLTYKENAPLQLITPFATISDADNAAFPGGTLSVEIDQNGGRSDHIQIRNQGNASGQIGVSGRTIRYGGVVIGSYRDGLPGSRLIIDLNANASAAITQALLRNIGYRNDSDNPSTNPRRVTVTFSDGSGGISAPVSKTVNVTAVNDAPRLVLGGQVAYQNNSAGVLLAPSATVTDADSANFAAALLTVEITTARGPSNRLQLGSGYSIDSDRLLRNGVVVGTVLENGFGWNDLRLRFNSQMTAARIQELIRSLRFRTVDNTNLDARVISFTLTDGDGGMSATQTKTVNITA